MKIPRRIKVGTHWVKLRHVKKLPDAIGYVEVSTNTIWIAKNNPSGSPVPESMQAETLLHEVMHYLSIQAGYGIQEAKCTAFASGLIGVIRENRLDFLNVE